MNDLGAVTAAAWRPGHAPPAEDGQATAGLPAAEAIMYVPARPATARQARGVAFETRMPAQGAPVLPVFTGLGRLVASLGADQPWIALPWRAVRVAVAAAYGPPLAVDPAVAAIPGARPGAGGPRGRAAP